MIRPITMICWVLALGAGLYLYRAKHEVELIDQHIDQIAKKTAELRVESRGLLDEWIRLGEPEQLHKYSDTYLGLKTIAPTQFARLSDLASRLPPPQADPPAETPADPTAETPAETKDMVAQSPDILSVEVPPPSAGPAVVDAVARQGAVPPPLNSANVQVVTAPPLQARPVTPRPPPARVANEPRSTTTGTAVEDVVRPPPAHVANEPRSTTTGTAVTTQVEPRLGAPGHANAPAPANTPAAGSATWQHPGLPPLQAQRQGNASGLPPLQAQGSGPGGSGPGGPAPGPAQWQGQAAGPGPAEGIAYGHAPGWSSPRQTDPRVADNRGSDPRREVRPMQTQYPQAQPAQAQWVDRGPVPQAERQGQPPPMAPAQGNSLLGMSRGPLPAPTPVSSITFSGSGNIPNGPGR